MEARELGQQAPDPVHRLDDVRARLAEHDHHHRGLAVRPARRCAGPPPNPRPAPRPTAAPRRRPGTRRSRPILLGVTSWSLVGDLPGLGPVGQLALGPVDVGAASTLRTSSRPMPYLCSAVGFSSTRTAGSELPPTKPGRRPPPGRASAGGWWTPRRTSARGSTCRRSGPRIRIGASAGLTLR